MRGWVRAAALCVGAALGLGAAWADTQPEHDEEAHETLLGDMGGCAPAWARGLTWACRRPASSRAWCRAACSAAAPTPA
jgi:hypothetical protein